MPQSTWSKRLRRLIGSDSPEGWVERMVLHATGELTPTEEYVFRHGVWTRKMEGESVPPEFALGEWDDRHREEFLAEGSRAAVEGALADLEEQGLIRRVGSPQEEGEGHWRLTEAGRAERARLLEQFREEIEELQRRHAIVAAGVIG